MKLCSSCGITKPKSLFYSDKSKVDGVRSNCKECHNISVEKRNSRPEVASLNADNRAKWELENKERRKIYKSDWFKQDSATNPEKYKAKYSKYYSSNKGLVLAKVRRRQLAKANRTPMWLDKVSRAEIDTAYIW